MASTTIKESVILILVALISACGASDYCYSDIYSGYTTYCPYGCCGYNSQDCCSGPVGLIVGLCVGGAVFLFFIILAICLCRRRRYGGFIYRSHAAAPATVVVQSNMSSQNGVVSTAGVQPGVTYPPYPQYQHYPTAPNSGYPAPGYPAPGYPAPGYPAGPPNYPTGPQPGYGYPQQPGAYSAEPPKYDSLNTNPSGGFTNQGFDAKN